MANRNNNNKLDSNEKRDLQRMLHASSRSQGLMQHLTIPMSAAGMACRREQMQVENTQLASEKASQNRTSITSNLNTMNVITSRRRVQGFMSDYNESN